VVAERAPRGESLLLRPSCIAICAIMEDSRRV